MHSSARNMSGAAGGTTPENRFCDGSPVSRPCTGHQKYERAPSPLVFRKDSKHIEELTENQENSFTMATHAEAAIFSRVRGFTPSGSDH
jgi:hypothetical protein